MMEKAMKITRGSGNIFADLGLPNADEHMLKARVVMLIARTIEQLGLTQQAAAKRMGISQPDVSNMIRGQFEHASLDRLLRYARALGADVEIKMKRPADQRKDWHEGRMSLTT